jgi:hypothetical protein
MANNDIFYPFPGFSRFLMLYDIAPFNPSVRPVSPPKRQYTISKKNKK